MQIYDRRLSIGRSYWRGENSPNMCNWIFARYNTAVNIGGLSIGETAKGTIDAMGKPVVPIDPVICVRVQTSSSRRDSSEPVILVRNHWNPEPFQLSHVTMSRETDREKEKERRRRKEDGCFSACLEHRQTPFDAEKTLAVCSPRSKNRAMRDAVSAV